MVRWLLVLMLSATFTTLSPSWPGCGVARADHVQCCRYCSKGKACGNTCIARNRTCRVGHGCACDANIRSDDIALVPLGEPLPQ
jgi:hypothetical protein